MSQSTTQILRQLHRLRKHLRELQSEIDLGPRVLKIQEQKLEAERQAHADWHDTIKKQKLKQKEDEVSLKSTEQRLAKLQADLNTAGSKKEFDAKTTEIEHATTLKGELEDAILATILDIEQRTDGIPAVEKRWKEAQQEFEQYKIDAAERLQRMLADQKVTQQELEKTEALLPIEVRGVYQRLIKSYGADGLASVVARACQQCRTNLTEQQRTSVLSGAFIVCPQCGRALYLAE